MNKTIFIGILASVLLISLIAAVSADANTSSFSANIANQFHNDKKGNDHDCNKLCSKSSTTIDGIIYQQGGNPNDNPIAGANVTVTCDKVTKSTLSNANGQYDVNFNSHQCGYGDSVTVTATKGTANGQETGNVSFQFKVGSYQCQTKVNVGVVDVPLVPEFGLTMGILTVIAASAAFFVIRRK